MKKNKIKNKKFFKSGFSLIEVLITLAVLSVGISAITLLMAKNIRSSQSARDQIIASELAQEGVELVRNLSYNSSTFFTNTSTGDYMIDFNSPYLRPLDFAGQLYSNKSDGSYANNNNTQYWTPTKFYRKVSIKNDGGNKQITVTCFVSWNSSNIPAPSSCTVGNKCLSVVSILPYPSAN